MASRNIRLGRVSKIDYEHGMIEVTYPDLDDSVSDLFPVFSMCDEYKMPNIGEEVAVLHLPNGESAGIVLGRYWNQDNTPVDYGYGVFRKELGPVFGEAWMEYQTDDQKLRFHTPKYDYSLGDIIEWLLRHEAWLEKHEAWLEKHEEWLKKHDERLDEHEAWLKRHDEKLDDHEKRIQKLEGGG